MGMKASIRTGKLISMELKMKKLDLISKRDNRNQLHQKSELRILNLIHSNAKHQQQCTTKKLKKLRVSSRHPQRLLESEVDSDNRPILDQLHKSKIPIQILDRLTESMDQE